MPTTVTTQPQLIAAINFDNKVGGAHTITLGADITLLETTPNNTHDGPNGLPEITINDILTIAGDGHTLQRSTSKNNVDFRLFDVGSGATLSLKNMTVKNGVVPGRAAMIIMGGGLLQGGAIFVDNGGKLNLNQVDLTDNAVTCTGVPHSVSQGAFLELQGGGIFNAGTVSIDSSSVTGNSANFNLANPAGQGDNLADSDSNSNDGDSAGDGFIGNVFVEGGGIYNTGHLFVTSSSISKNSATSTVTNGNPSPNAAIGNGDHDGSNDPSGFNDAESDGNGLNGNITVEGGGIYNAGTTTLMGGSVTGNSASSNVTNGSDNGDTDGNASNGGDGDDNGNGVVGNITVAGAGIYSDGIMLSATGTGLSGNFTSSTVVNGSNNGQSNGTGVEGGTGIDDGNGVVGNILVAGGAVANDANGTANLDQCNVSGNAVKSSITNGNSNGQNDGDDDGAQPNANDGNGVTGTVEVAGGGIDNEGSFTINSGSVSHNSATSFVTNGSFDGIACGNSSDTSGLTDDGDGLAGTLSVEGGGVHNAGSTMKITSATLSNNSAASSVTIGLDDGDNSGSSSVESDQGDGVGNGVSGNLLIGGGAIANDGALKVAMCTLTSNTLKSTIGTGNDNGVNDGQSDGSNNDCGNNCGNGVGVDGGGVVVEVAGGAILNTGGSTTVTSCSITGNSASSSVTNSAGNGLGDGDESTGTDGQGDGNGVNGDVEVMGGGTANLGGSLAFVTPTNNHVSSTPTNGSDNLASDGVVVNGTVTVSGQNTFAPLALDNAGRALESQAGQEVPGLALPPSGSGPSVLLDSPQPPASIQGNQPTLMELPVSVYETPGSSAHTAIPALHTPSHSIDPDAFFLDPWDELS